MTPLYVPREETRTEMVVINSRFIATLAPASSVEQAKSFIHKIKNEFSDASHNVPAFIIGHGSSVTTHCSDDGEPSGTAGRPALAVLQGSGLGDLVTVISRYFGGTKLGKGGLVRAYSDAVRMVLKVVPLAEKTTTCTVLFVIPYHYYEQVKLVAKKHRVEILDQVFMSDVTITCRMRSDDFAEFKMNLTEKTNGTIEIFQLETNPDTLLSVHTPTDLRY